MAMVTTDDVMTEVEKLSRMVADSSISLDELPAAIENRSIAAIEDELATDAEGEAIPDDQTAVDKWFTRPTADGETVDTDPEVVTITSEDCTVEYVVVESQMYSEKKDNRGPKDDDGTYAARWVVGEDDSTTQDYFIHRVEWKSSFTNPLSELTESTTDQSPLEVVRGWLGFEQPLPEDLTDVESHTWYQAQGDIAFQFRDFEDWVKQQAEQLAQESINTEKHGLIEEWIDEHSQFNDLDGFRISVTTPSLSNIGTVNCRVKRSTTDGLKELQTDLNLDEETIRRKMRDDWTRLTANRRKKIIERVMKQKPKAYADTHSPNEKEILDKKKQAVRSNINSNLQRQNVIIGNHIVIVARAMATTGQGRETLVLPQSTEVRVLHDEHGNLSRTIGPTVLDIDILDRHERN
jgi:hypothetical protein